MSQEDLDKRIAALREEGYVVVERALVPPILCQMVASMLSRYRDGLVETLRDDIVAGKLSEEEIDRRQEEIVGLFDAVRQFS